MTDLHGSHVVVVGDALIDEIRDGDRFREFVGGAALNVAVGLTRLGVPATLVAMVGDDPDGDSIRAFLARFGVRLVATEAPRGTARATSVREGGEPRYEFNDAAVNRAIVFDPAAREAIASAPLVVVSCYPFDRDQPIDALLDAVEDPAQRLVVDPNPRTGMMSDVGAFARNLDRIAPLARLIKIGDEDAALLYDLPLEEAAARLRRDGAAFVLATGGRRGAHLLTAEGTFHADIADLAGPVVDTMGAGDATLAAMTDALLRADRQGTSDALYWEGALQNAMIIAGATCRAEGALLQLP